MVATVERLIEVCRLRAGVAIQIKHRSRLLVMFAVMSLCILFRLPVYWELEVDYIPWCTGFAQVTLRHSWLGENPDYRAYYQVYASHVIRVFFPFIALLILNVLIVWQWHRALAPANKQMQHKMSLIPAEYMLVPAASVATPVMEAFSQRRRVRRDLGRKGLKAAMNMMIVIVCSYLICSLLNVVITFWEHINPKYLATHEKFYTFTCDCVSLLTIINSSLRLPIYYLFNPKFRRELKAVLRMPKRAPKRGHPSPEAIRNWYFSSSPNTRRNPRMVCDLDDEESCILIAETDLSNSPWRQDSEQTMPNGQLCSETEDDEIRIVHFV